MDYKKMPVYSSITNKINVYQQDNNGSKPSRIIMSEVTNKKLADEINFLKGNESCLSISIIFGLNIEIDETLYDFDITILGKKK